MMDPLFKKKYIVAELSSSQSSSLKWSNGYNTLKWPMAEKILM